MNMSPMDNLQGMNSINNIQPSYMYSAYDYNNNDRNHDNCNNHNNYNNHDNYNSMNNASCYSEASMKYAQDILNFIYAEYSDYRYYMNMCENCCSMQNRRILKSIADDELRHCNLFVSAYFLITGKRFCPAKSCSTEYTGSESLAENLRERYFEELAGAQNYADYAKGVDDECLKRLLMEVSEDEKEHSMMIMDMIRRLCACD